MEIEFRGKGIKSNKWLYGDLIHNRGLIYIAPIGIADENALAGDFEINEKSIGQYTGRKDTKQTKIYSGDIITVNGKYPKLVEYRTECMAFCIANLDELKDKDCYPWQQPAMDWWSDSKREILVIGNIIDNKNLLEENK